MGKVIKIISIIIAVILGLIIAGIIALYIYFSKPERYKPLIEKVVYDATSRTLHLNGEVKFTIYPYIGFHIGNTTLSNPAGFKKANMLQFDSADLSISLLPLLSGSVIINKLAFNGLTVDLVKTSEDQNNWTFTPTSKYVAIESSTVHTNSTNTTEPIEVSSNNTTTVVADKDKGKDRPLVLELKALTLKDATINYDDLTTKSHKGLSNFSLKIDTSYGGIIKVDINKEQVILNKANINFNDIVTGNINLNLDNFNSPVYKGDIDLPEFSLNALLTKLNLNLTPPKPLFNKFALKAKFAGDMIKANLTINKFSFGSRLEGDVIANVQDFATKPSYNGSVNLKSSSLHELLVALNLSSATKTKNNSKASDSLSLVSDFNGTTTKANLKIKRFSYANNVNATADLSLVSMEPLSYKGTINLQPFSLNNLMTNLGMEQLKLPNKHVLDKVSLQANLSGSKSRASLNSLVLHIADSTLKGKADISSFSPLAVSENLTLDHAEIADFVDIRGYRLPIQAVNLTGNTKLDVNMQIPGGVSGKQVLDIHNATLKGFSVDLFIAQVDSQIQAALNALSNGANVTAKLNSLGQVAKAINQMKAGLSSQIKAGNKDLSKQTDLGRVSVNLIINKGVISPSSFSVHGPSLAVDGNGLVNLNNRTIDYTVHTKLVTKQKNDVLNTITFPYKIKGKFDSTTGGADWNSVQSQLTNYYVNMYKKQLQDKLQSEVKAQANKQIDKLKDNLKNNASKYLKNLF